jgi:neutral ceramidase
MIADPRKIPSILDRNGYALDDCSHNHPGLRWSNDTPYWRRVIERVASATSGAAKEMPRVSLGYGEGEIHFNINHRAVINGRAVVRLNPDGPCDRTVKVLQVDDGRGLARMAVIMHAVCHPRVFNWGGQVLGPLPQRLPQDERRLPGRGPAVHGDGLR